LRAVIDEGVPRRVVPTLQEFGCDVSYFPNDWKGLKNGRLLARIEEAGFGTLITCDKSMRFQQNIHRSRIALIVLPAQLFDDLVPFGPEIAKAVNDAAVGDALVINRYR
jgi:hypothetical protein